MKTNEDQTGKKYLSEMIEFERDIAPHPITLILGGVGCGKTSFIKNLADGTIPGAEDLRFCFVTNRKNRVNQTVFDVYDDDRNINLFIDKLYYRGNLYEPGMGQMITNTGYEYIPDETLTNRRTSRMPSLGFSCTRYTKLSASKALTQFMTSCLSCSMYLYLMKFTP